jgi:hypothetical protein
MERHREIWCLVRQVFQALINSIFRVPFSRSQAEEGVSSIFQSVTNSHKFTLCHIPKTVTFTATAMLIRNLTL